MFFEPKDGMKPHPFTHSIYKSLVVPRPIGWISTVNKEGIVNLAPFSFFNAVSENPPYVAYCPNGWKPGTQEPKDSLINAEETGEFVFNLCTYELREQMNATSMNAPNHIDEMAEVGLESAPCQLVKPPRVKASPIVMECKYMQTVKLPGPGDGSSNNLVIGQVVGIHVSEEVITDGIIDIQKVNPISRLGYLDYASLGEVFSMDRPK